MAESSSSKDYSQGDSKNFAEKESNPGISRAGSFTLGKRSFNLEKESNPAPKPMTAENAARIDIDEKKNPSKRRRGGPDIFKTFSRSDARELRDDEEGIYLVKDFSRSIFNLDLWNRPIWEMIKDEIAANPDHPEAIKTRAKMLRAEKNRPRVDAEYLNALCPNYVPVAVEKDPRSDLPEIYGNLFHVPGDVTLDEFLERVEMNLYVALKEGQPMYVYFKKTQFPNEALMFEIFKENADEDGYLRMIYSGEDTYTPQ